MTAADRSEPALVFVHLPKTAGQSLRGVLRLRFSPQETYEGGATPRDLLGRVIEDIQAKGPRPPGPVPAYHAPLNVRELREMEEARRRDLRLVMGHFWFGAHDVLPRPSIYVTLVRDPVSRVLSLYHHRVRNQGLDVSLERYLADARDPQAENDQTRRLGGDPARALDLYPCAPELLAIAEGRLRRSFAVVGTTDRFDEAFRLLAGTLGWEEGPRYDVENVGEGRPRPEDLPRSLLLRIEELNALDLELHAFARRVMEERSAEAGSESLVRAVSPQGTALFVDRLVPRGRAGPARPDGLGDRLTAPYPPVAGQDADHEWQALMFLHIPKTAGLNLRHVINYQYGLENVCVPEPPVDVTKEVPYWRYLEEGVSLPQRGTPGYDPNADARRRLLAWTEQGRFPRVVMGHFWYGLHEDLDRPSSYFTVLREPVERALSVYFHRRDQYGLRLTLEEWVESARDFQLDNAQTRLLCGPLPDVDVRFAHCTQEMVDLAKQRLREVFAVVGITERFDESFLLMARLLGWRNPSYGLFNVNRRRPRGPQIPTELREAVADHNRFDRELYRFAQQLLDEQLAALDPQIDKRTLRGLRRTNLVRRSAVLRKIYPVARPAIRTARRIGRQLRGV